MKKVAIKIFSIIIVAFLMFGLVACASSKNQGQNNNDKQEQTNDSKTEQENDGKLKSNFQNLSLVWNEIVTAKNLTIAVMEYEDEWGWYKEETKLTDTAICFTEFLPDDIEPQDVEDIWITTKVQDEILGTRYFSYYFPFENDRWERTLITKGDYEDEIKYTVTYVLDDLQEIFLSNSLIYRGNTTSSFGNGATYEASSALLAEKGCSSVKIQCVDGVVYVDIYEEDERYVYRLSNFGTTTVTVPKTYTVMPLQ